MTSDFTDTFSSYSNEIHFVPASGTIYADSGEVVNATTGAKLGSFPVRGVMVPYPSFNAACFLYMPTGQSGYLTMALYNLTTRAFHKSAPVPWTPTNFQADYPNRLIAWGKNGLASCGSKNTINIYSGSFLGNITTSPTPARETLVVSWPKF
jgi:hypothetical protein